MSYDNGRPTNHDRSPPSSGTTTPTPSAGGGSSVYSGGGGGSLSSIGNVFSGLIRRFSGSTSSVSSSGPASPQATGNGITSVYNPKSAAQHQPNSRRRTPSPFRPPPLDPLVLMGYRESTPESARLLSKAVAEEVRIMVPARLQIVEHWRLIYSLEQDGASLATLYQRCAKFKGQRVGFVLVVRDLEGGTFGAYMSDYPHPSPKYFGNGECFLWRASVVESPKPPPSAPETPALSRGTTTISSSSSSSSVSFATAAARNYTPLAPPSEQTLVADLEGVTQQTSSSDVSTPSTGSSTVRPSLLHHADSSASSLGVASGAMATQDSLAATSTSTSSLPTPKTFSPGLPPPSPAPSAPRIRFKAFPHSGENDYYMQCEAHFLSLGAGDGHYGLWLDDGLSRGVSSRCDTFGNEPLSDEGIKFNVLGVEVWVIGASSGS